LPERWPDVTVAPLRQGVTTEVRGNCGLRPVSQTRNTLTNSMQFADGSFQIGRRGGFDSLTRAPRI